MNKEQLKEYILSDSLLNDLYTYIDYEELKEVIEDKDDTINIIETGVSVILNNIISHYNKS